MSNDGKWMTLENPIFNFDKNDNFAKFHFEYTKSNPPSELFHYTNGDSVLKILKSGCIHATESTYLNDPYERVYGENLLVEKINNLSDLKFKNKVLEALKSNSEKGKFLTFIFSLSENPNILSQWREYAYQGKGSIIGFDSSVIFDRAGFGEFALRNINLDKLPREITFSFHLLKVIYDKNEQNELIDMFLEKSYTYWLENKLNEEDEYNIFSFTLNHRLKELLTILKHPSSIEEREWRIVASVHLDSPKINFKFSKYGITPYLMVNLSKREEISLNKLPISRIILGSNSIENKNSLGLKILLKKLDYNVEICTSEIVFRE